MASDSAQQAQAIWGWQVQPAGEAQVVIDLGDRDWSADTAPRGGFARPVLALVLAVVVLVAHAGSAAPSLLVQRPLWQAPGNYVVAFGDYAFVIRSIKPVVTAVALHNGKQLWRRDVAAQTGAAEVSLAELGPGLLGLTLLRYPNGSGLPNEDSVTQVVDAATGALLRTLPGAAVGTVSRHGLVVMAEPAPPARTPTCPPPACADGSSFLVDPQTGRIARSNGSVPCQQVSACGDLVALDPRTGTRAWRLLAAPDRVALWRRDANGELTGLGRLDRRGHFVQYDLGTGRELRDSSVPYWDGSLTPAEAAVRGSFYYLGDLLIQVSGADRQGPARVSTVNLADGRVWSAGLPPGPPGFGEGFYVWSCGPAMCVWVGDSTLAFAPATGETIGRARTFAVSVGSGNLVTWDFDQGPDPAAGLAIFDLVTKQVTGTVAGQFQLVGRPGHPPLVTVPAKVRGGTDVYAITPEGRAGLVATIGPVSFCTASANVIVCGNDKPDGMPDQIVAWRLPPAAG